jgi:membrane protein implicated in regulation of membrane protease activity
MISLIALVLGILAIPMGIAAIVVLANTIVKYELVAVRRNQKEKPKRKPQVIETINGEMLEVIDTHNETMYENEASQS